MVSKSLACVSRQILHYLIYPVISAAKNRQEHAADEVMFEALEFLMRGCFQVDSDVESVVSTVRQRYGHIEVYLSSDETSSESLIFFQVRFILYISIMNLCDADNI